MGRWLRTLSNKIKTTAMVATLLAAQVAGAALPFMPAATVHAASICTVDTAGANDEPGQKDLNQLCVNYDNVPTTVATTWNWDETGTNGANTMDACNLFDTDGDGNINYAVCVSTQNDPAVFQSTTTYSCGDAKTDRCTSAVTVVPNGTTNCSVSQVNTDPFPGPPNSAKGDSYPKDTQGSCTVDLSAVGGANAKLVDVCSYPSTQPNSDPSDCVIAREKAGKLEVQKVLNPANDPGKFNLQVDGTTKATDVGNGGTTGEVVVSEGNHSVGELAGTGTSLASYASNIVCKDLNGTGSIVAQGSGTSLANVLIPDGSDIVCVITNTASSSITIVKDAVPNSAQDFAFTAMGTGVSDFSLDDDADPTLSNTKTFNGLAAGQYTFTETAVNGWDFGNITCSAGATVQKNGASVTITLSAGQNVTCTYTNLIRGLVVVHKVTNPANDPTNFQITASGTGSITGNPVQNITTSQDVNYDVSQGTYAVNEAVPAGWSQTSNTCSNLVINANTPLVNGVPTVTCTITNTKLAKLTIIKDAVPNDAQDFAFTTTGTGLSSFSLDDDADATLSNTKTFTNLNPGSYSVSEQATAGWQLTHLACDTNNFTTAGSQVNVNLAAGQETTCTYTNTKLGSISGTKYEANADGSTVMALGGWTICLDANNNGVCDPSESTQLTGVDGSFGFSGLLPGTYSLLENLINGWTQIFHPSSVNLTAGQNSTGNNFGNFHNGSIGGYKWNDADASGTLNGNESKLSGWTIKLFSGNTEINSTLTDVNGNYSFTNLAPGTYGVCEVQQAGWVQTFPANNACHVIVIDQSGETNANTNFGNQGRGTIKVVKNVDSDGNGSIDFQDVTNWNWNIDGSGNFTTGSGNSQNVAAGNHTVAEVQKAGYHVTASSCSDETVPANPTTSLGVNVAPGENVTCTFTNTRDTGTVTVNKVVNPSDDEGLFNLNIGATTYAANVGDGGTTGAVQLPTGNYTISETAGTDTNLADYSSTYICTDGQSGSGISVNVSVTSNGSVSCTFTNVRYAHIVIEKQTLPDGSDQSFGFDASYNLLGFSLQDGQSNNSGNLLPDTYTVGESATNGWDLTDLSCDSEDIEVDGSMVSINLAAGQTVTCTFTNTQRGAVHGTKTIVNNDGSTADSQTGIANVTVNLYTGSSAILANLIDSTQTDANGNYSFTDLVPGDYFVEEVVPQGYAQIGGGGSFTIAPGEDETANGTVDFTNFEKGSISGYKFNDLNGDGVKGQSEPKLPGWTINLLQNDSVIDDTVTDANGNYSFSGLLPGDYEVCEVPQDGWTQTSTPECFTITIDESGESDTAVFGNQGRATITVIKNVDLNGDGDTTDPGEANVSDWNWDLAGEYYSDSNIATGSSRSNIPAGDYIVTEQQKNDYHFVSVTCDGQEVTQSELTTVTLNPGANITCTFTNARDTGFISVTKYLNPEEDDGLFDLNIDSNTEAADVSDGGTTGNVRVLTGTHNVSELAGTDTDLGDYDSSYTCWIGERLLLEGEGTMSDDFNVSTGQHVHCYFYNVRHANLTVIKKAFPFGTSQAFSFTLSKVTPLDEEDNEILDFIGDTTLVKNFQLDDNNDPALPNSNGSSLSPGVYEVTEAGTDGWNLIDMDCGDVTTVMTATSIRFELEPGQQLTCTFTNQKKVVPQVLGDSTVKQLTNTGLPIVAFTLAAMTLLSTALYVGTTRRQL